MPEHTLTRWIGRTPWDVPVGVWLIEIESAFSHAWRVTWGPPGAQRSGGQTLDSRAEADAFAAAKRAEIGTNWEPQQLG